MVDKDRENVKGFNKIIRLFQRAIKDNGTDYVVKLKNNLLIIVERARLVCVYFLVNYNRL